MHGEIEQKISFDEFELNRTHRQLFRDGRPVELYAKTFDLLVCLIENNGRVLTKGEILDRVWENQFVEESNLAVQISVLRKALGETVGQPRYLITVPGKGYKFVADVSGARGPEIIIEKHRLSRIVIEENETSDPVKAAVDRPVASENETAGFRLNRWVLRAGAILMLAFLVLGIYHLIPRGRPASLFPAPKLTRLTNSGKVECVALSPDGKYLAYVLAESDGNSLWLRQIRTASDIKILSPQKAQFWGLTFSPDGGFIYFNLFSADRIDLELFRVPTLGGVEEKIPNVSSARVAFSPDGRRMAYIKSQSDESYNALTVSDTDGENQRIVAKKSYPETFKFMVNPVSWSPDGKVIAGLVGRTGDKGNFTEIVGFDPENGNEFSINSKRWFEVTGIDWVKDAGGLVVSAKDVPSAPNQIWFVPYGSGEPQKITNDLNQYYEVSLASDGQILAAIQTTGINGIFVGENGSEDFREIVSEVGDLSPVEWTPNGEIIFRSNKDGRSNLWKIDPESGDRRQLTVNAEVASRGLCLSRDGKSIVFSSWRSGGLNLWRIDPDGKNLTQLTTGGEDAFPRCLPDNDTVVFQRGMFSNPRLWQVSLSGGGESRLTGFNSKWPAVAVGGERVSFFQMRDDKWRVGFTGKTGELLPETLNVPSNHKGDRIYWSAKNNSMFYIGADGGIGNIWSLPSEPGREPRPITGFKSQWMADFAVSSDEKNLAVVRSKSFSDVVLIENTRFVE
ncbi:MAG: winged helix-turn-helix domain-containing protein [Pyrinomonadaceae bacterium]